MYGYAEGFGVCLFGAMVLVLSGLAGCVSGAGRALEVEEGPVAATEFRPATYHSRIHEGDSRYPNLFSDGSYAVWVGEDVAELKRQKELEGGATIDLSLERAAAIVGENYYVFECHFESAFPDSSIAFDIVGLRNLDLYLLTPDGLRVRPLQRLMDGHAEEDHRAALRVFRRINIVVFPKRDIISGAPTLSCDISSVRLVAEGFNSSFYFEWKAAPQILPAAESLSGEEESGLHWSPTVVEAYDSVKLGFTDLFTRLRALAEHMH